ncbi:hypothetical protein G6F31_020514 [Rhizopus arrhizus]|nr:hypothetical protein G6F31_020514 [Rhizopus arrhizus]
MRSSVAGAGCAGLSAAATQPGCGTAACCTSSGATLPTGPGVPDVATRMALKAAAASSSGVDTSTTHLAIEPNIFW